MAQARGELERGRDGAREHVPREAEHAQAREEPPPLNLLCRRLEIVLRRLRRCHRPRERTLELVPAELEDGEVGERLERQRNGAFEKVVREIEEAQRGRAPHEFLAELAREAVLREREHLERGREHPREHSFERVERGVEEPELARVLELARQLPVEAVRREVHHRELREPSEERRGEAPREAVPREAEHAELRELRELPRDGAAELVVGEVELLEVAQPREGAPREQAGEPAASEREAGDTRSRAQALHPFPLAVGAVARDPPLRTRPTVGAARRGEQLLEREALVALHRAQPCGRARLRPERLLERHSLQVWRLQPPPLRRRRGGGGGGGGRRRTAGSRLRPHRRLRRRVRLRRSVEAAPHKPVLALLLLPPLLFVLLALRHLRRAARVALLLERRRLRNSGRHRRRHRRVPRIVALR
mmetsp:Transcript_1900/g.6957  ORF Transcript_1900/g.6957 Transcript_1900/m.6957 type:complete len:420 (+) Transcript_1900:1880-3139(+)